MKGIADIAHVNNAIFKLIFLYKRAFIISLLIEIKTINYETYIQNVRLNANIGDDLACDLVFKSKSYKNQWRMDSNQLDISFVYFSTGY